MAKTHRTTPIAIPTTPISGSAGVDGVVEGIMVEEGMGKNVMVGGLILTREPLADTLPVKAHSC